MRKLIPSTGKKLVKAVIVAEIAAAGAAFWGFVLVKNNQGQCGRVFHAFLSFHRK